MTERWAHIVVGVSFVFRNKNYQYWTDSLPFNWYAFNGSDYAELNGTISLVKGAFGSLDFVLHYRLEWNSSYILIEPILSANLKYPIYNAKLFLKFENISVNGDAGNDFCAFHFNNETYQYFLPVYFACSVINISESLNHLFIYDNATWKFVDLMWDWNHTLNGGSKSTGVSINGYGTFLQLNFTFRDLSSKFILQQSLWWHDPTEVRYLRNAISDNKTFPSAYNILKGSLSSGTLSNLQASDNVYMSFNSASDGKVEIEFIGNITGHMPFLQVDLEAHSSYSPPAGVYQILELAAYNWQTGAYETTGSMHTNRSIGLSDVHLYLHNMFGNKGKYVSATGAWKVKVKCTTSNGAAFILHLDYLTFRSVCYQLGTAQTTTAASNDAFVDGLQVGIRVWGITSDESEVEITAGSPVAVVVGPSETITLSATWNCPSTVQYVAYFIIVYRENDRMRTADESSGGLPLLFQTEDLNASLAAATWTVYYAFYYNPTMDETYFRFGTTTFNSRIENFGWNVPSPREWRNIDLLSFNITSRKWVVIQSETVNVIVKQWNFIEMFTFEMLTRQWRNLQIAILNVAIKQWRHLQTLIYTIITKKWDFIDFLIFKGIVKQWNVLDSLAFTVNLIEKFPFIISAGAALIAAIAVIIIKKR